MICEKAGEDIVCAPPEEEEGSKKEGSAQPTIEAWNTIAAKLEKAVSH